MSDGKIRLKDLDAHSKEKYESLSPELKSFVKEYEELTGGVFKLTSGRRKPTDKFSHHHNGDALDFSHANYEDYNFLMNTKEGLSLMSKYNLGIIDETDPVMMKKTKATGAHFHVGKDSAYAKKTQERLASWGNEEFKTVYSYKQRYEMGEDPKDIIVDKEDHTGHNHEIKEEDYYVPFEDKQYQDIFGRVAEKEIIQDVKTEQSSDRKTLKSEMSIQEAFLSEYLKAPNKVVPRNSGQTTLTEVEPIRINIDLQPQLPNLEL